MTYPIQRQSDQYTWRFSRRLTAAEIVDDTLDRLGREFSDYATERGLSNPYDAAAAPGTGRGAVGYWPNIENFLKDNYPASHRGLTYGFEDADYLIKMEEGDHPPQWLPVALQGKDPYETGPDAIATHGYDPKEVAATMLLLHNESHPGRTSVVAHDRDFLLDLVQKRMKMQRDYEQRGIAPGNDSFGQFVDQIGPELDKLTEPQKQPVTAQRLAVHRTAAHEHVESGQRGRPDWTGCAHPHPLTADEAHEYGVAHDKPTVMMHIRQRSVPTPVGHHTASTDGIRYAAGNKPSDWENPIKGGPQTLYRGLVVPSPVDLEGLARSVGRNWTTDDDRASYFSDPFEYEGVPSTDTKGYRGGEGPFVGVHLEGEWDGNPDSVDHDWERVHYDEDEVRLKPGTPVNVTRMHYVYPDHGWDDENALVDGPKKFHASTDGIPVLHRGVGLLRDQMPPELTDRLDHVLDGGHDPELPGHLLDHLSRQGRGVGAFWSQHPSLAEWYSKYTMGSPAGSRWRPADYHVMVTSPGIPNDAKQEMVGGRPIHVVRQRTPMQVNSVSIRRPRPDDLNNPVSYNYPDQFDDTGWVPLGGDRTDGIRYAHIVEADVAEDLHRLAGFKTASHEHVPSGQRGRPDWTGCAHPECRPDLPTTMYHVSHPRNRDSIAQHGLLTSYSEDDEFSDALGMPHGVYMTSDEPKLSHDTERWPGDVWSIDITKLKHLENDFPGGMLFRNAYATKYDVPPEAIRLHRPSTHHTEDGRGWSEYEQSRHARLAMAWDQWAPQIQGGCEHGCDHSRMTMGEYSIAHPFGRSALQFTHDTAADGTPELYISGVHTHEKHRRSGVAEALMRRLHDDHPGTRINPGSMTDMGQGFHDRMLEKEPDARAVVTAGIHGDLLVTAADYDDTPYWADAWDDEDDDDDDLVRRVALVRDPVPTETRLRSRIPHLPLDGPLSDHPAAQRFQEYLDAGLADPDPQEALEEYLSVWRPDDRIHYDELQRYIGDQPSDSYPYPPRRPIPATPREPDAVVTYPPGYELEYDDPRPGSHYISAAIRLYGQPRRGEDLNSVMQQRTAATRDDGSCAGGDCYESALNYLRDHMTNPNIRLVHGEVEGQGPLEGVTFGHAWVEDGDTVIDRANGRDIRMPKQMYYDINGIGRLNNYHSYKPSQALRRALDTGRYGPWDLVGRDVRWMDSPQWEGEAEDTVKTAMRLTAATPVTVYHGTSPDKAQAILDGQSWLPGNGGWFTSEYDRARAYGPSVIALDLPPHRVPARQPEFYLPRQTRILRKGPFRLAEPKETTDV